MSGLLSQSITNLVNYNAHLATLTNLPASAMGVKNAAQSSINTDISAMKQVQTEVLSTSTSIINELQNALSKLKAGNKPESAVLVNTANGQSINLNSFLENQSNVITSSKTQILGFSKTLLTIHAQLQSESDAISVKEQQAKDTAAKYNKEKYYFLALGPFGLAGLATAIALLETWNSKANSYSAKASAMQAQINSLNVLMSNVNNLNSDFSKVISLISNLKNAVGFLSSDIKEVVNDLNTSGSNPNLAELYLTTAINEAKTLHTDAS